MAVTNTNKLPMKKIIIILLFFGLTFTGYAQSPTNSDLKKSQLNGHTFLDYSQSNNAFITTSLMINVGVGSTSTITIPPIDINGVSTPAINGTIMFAETGINYQQRFTPWLSLNINAIMVGRFGVNAFSLLFDGVNTISGGSIGWRIRMIRTKKLILTTGVFVKNLNGNFINIKQFVNDAIDGDPNASIVKNTPAMAEGINFEGTYAINETWGLQAATQWAYGESFVRGKESFTSKTSFLGEADFYPKHKLPLGIGLGYMLSSVPEISMEGGDYLSLGILKLAYTGSTDFDLGVEYLTYKMKLSNRLKNPLVTQLILSLKFYF